MYSLKVLTSQRPCSKGCRNETHARGIFLSICIENGKFKVRGSQQGGALLRLTVKILALLQLTVKTSFLCGFWKIEKGVSF